MVEIPLEDGVDVFAELDKDPCEKVRYLRVSTRCHDAQVYYQITDFSGLCSTWRTV